MKKAINILNIVSLIAIIPACALVPFFLSGDPRTSFIGLWFFWVLFLPLIPLIPRGFSLSNNKDKISPKIWLTIYAVMVTIYVVSSLFLGIIGHTRDLPAAFRKEYVSVEGEARVLDEKSNKIIVAGQEFTLDNGKFNKAKSSENYRVIYLPNSKYVIDIINDDGKTLLKK